MQLASEVGRHLPYLRRYARALLGSQPSGDALVKTCLQRVLAGHQSPDGVQDPRLALYYHLHEALRAAHAPEAAEADGQFLADGEILASRIDRLTAAKRQLLLLSELEGFSLPDVAQIMRLEVHEASDLLASAKADLRSQRATRLLIIEDEPIIALDIAMTVERSGHAVVGIASTHKEAVALAQKHRPELILADIQLADNSSGLDAVREIIEGAMVPVIFITAFPERLLTGLRPEPTFLITKPFDPDTLHISISQALAMAEASIRA